jgi:hypothetical protein
MGRFWPLGRPFCVAVAGSLGRRNPQRQAPRADMDMWWLNLPIRAEEPSAAVSGPQWHPTCVAVAGPPDQQDPKRGHPRLDVDTCWLDLPAAVL